MVVGVRELKNHLSEYLARVAGGEEVVVTDRGRPVARITAAGAEAALTRLVDEGIVAPPQMAKRPAGRERLRVAGSVSELVAEQRG